MLLAPRFKPLYEPRRNAFAGTSQRYRPKYAMRYAQYLEAPKLPSIVPTSAPADPRRAAFRDRVAIASDAVNAALELERLKSPQEQKAAWTAALEARTTKRKTAQS
jgi:hypothetical protein